jgi:ubiquitin carboxyl-terminal hydrolase 36/42
MPSFAEGGATTTLQTIANLSLASNTFKAIIENPLRFEKANLSITNGLNGRYTPLNKPFNLSNGSMNRIQNGVDTYRSSSSMTGGSGQKDEEQDDRPVNGEKSNQKDENISADWSRILQRPPGLKNFANTCYMNSTLQALMHIPPLVGYLLSGTHSLNCITSNHYSKK